MSPPVYNDANDPRIIDLYNFVNTYGRRPIGTVGDVERDLYLRLKRVEKSAAENAILREGLIDLNKKIESKTGVSNYFATHGEKSERKAFIDPRPGFIQHNHVTGKTDTKYGGLRKTRSLCDTDVATGRRKPSTIIRFPRELVEKVRRDMAIAASSNITPVENNIAPASTVTNATDEICHIIGDDMTCCDWDVIL